MVEFLKYWWGNFSIGWGFGQHWVEGFGVLSGLVAGFLAYRRSKEHRRKWEEWTIRVSFSVFVLSVLISTFVLAPYLEHRKSKVVADLQMSVLEYRYNPDTDELVVDVQFINSGTKIRRVMGAAFTYRVHTEYDNHIMGAPAGEANINQATNVQPDGQPTFTTYRHRLENEGVIRSSGIIFGIQLLSTHPELEMNYTTVEVTTSIQSVDDKTVVLPTGFRSALSMDKEFGYYPVKRPAP